MRSKYKVLLLIADKKQAIQGSAKRKDQTDLVGREGFELRQQTK